MQTSNSTQLKIPHILLSLLFTIITIFIIFNSTTLTAHATESKSQSKNTNDKIESNAGGNGTGTDASKDATRNNVVEGPSATKQFWLLSIHTETGARISSVKMFVSQEIVADKWYTQTRPEHDSGAPDETLLGSPFGWSYDSGGHGRGTEVKQWLISTDTEAAIPQARAYTLIENLWGEEMAQAFISQHWYLCLENGMWCGFYEGGEYTGKILAATAYGWALYNQINSDALWDESGEENGAWMINLYSNDVLPHSSMLEFSQTGLAQPTKLTGKLSNAEIKSAGYGCIIVWADELGLNNSTHTWDYSKTTPDKAPTPEDGDPAKTIPDEEKIYTIIKSYRIEDQDNNYTDKGTYIREQTVATIIIEDEPLGDGRNYKVIGWKQSSTSKPSDLTSLNWESSVPQSIGDTGTTSGSTTLDTQHKYLYVLLEAETGEDTPEALDANYILSQSSITRRINYSAPDSQQTNMTTKLNEYKFIFNLPEHSPTTCTGHIWYHNDDDSNCDNHHTERESGEHDCTQYAITGTHASDCGIYDEEEWEVCDSHTYTCTDLTF